MEMMYFDPTGHVPVVMAVAESAVLVPSSDN